MRSNRHMPTPARSGACAGLDHLAGQNHCVSVKWHEPAAVTGAVDLVAPLDMLAGQRATPRRGSGTRRPDLLLVVAKRRIMPAQREARLGKLLHDRHSKGAHVVAVRLSR